MTTYKLLIKNAKQIVTIRSDHAPYAVKDEMKHVEVITGAPDACLAIDSTGRIAHISSTYASLESHLLSINNNNNNNGGKPLTFTTTIDAQQGSVLPGFVDPHTHPVWSGDRVHEFAMKLAGATYLDIHRAGGGIGYTVERTRASSEAELLALFRERLDRMLRLGTTLCEAKSGYGLDTATELKMLRVIHAAEHPVERVATFLGAHSVPKGTTADAQTRLLVEETIPALKAARDAGEIAPEIVDVFHEQGIFEYDNTKRILEAGRDALGLIIGFHGDELHHVRAAELAGLLGARSVSHLEMVSDEGIAAMAAAATAAILLPSTAYLMRLAPPPARKLIEGGVPVALGSDFNPNAFCLSMPMTMNLGCVLLGMSMEEALVAGTLNAAYAINREKDYGTLEVGKFGDCLILDAPRWEHVIYEMCDPPITHVIKKGDIVYQK